MIRLFWLPALMLATGCGAGADQRAWQLRHQLATNGLEKPRECIDKTTTLIAAEAKENGDPPRNNPEAWYAGSEMSGLYHMRALCRKELHQDAAALADLERAAALYDDYCRRAQMHRAQIMIKIQCPGAAEDSERLAQWKKGAK
jgi:hypothetical protein